MPRSLVLRIAGYYATRELIPLYGVYSLLFSDHGLSPGEISSLFVVWSFTSFVFEVPSGAWADTVDRRRLLVCSAYLYALGFAAWMALPMYAGFAAGFALWGVSGALMSGTFEALVYDELATRTAAAGYARVIGWAESAAMAATLAAIAAAGPLYAWGGYQLVGWVSVGVAAVHGLLAHTLPTAPPVGVPTRQGEPFARRYLGMLRAGVGEAARHRRVRHVVVVFALLYGLTAYDEYFPIVAREGGVPTESVPLLMALVTAGQVLGTALAGWTSTMRARIAAVLVAASAVLVAAGALGGGVAGFMAIAAGYGVVHNVIIVTEARLQQLVEGPARATVTSVAGLSTEVVTLSLYGMFGLGSAWLPVTVLLALGCLPMLAVAAAAGRWLPAAAGAEGAAEPSVHD